MKKEFKKVSLLDTFGYYDMLLEDEKEYILYNFEELGFNELSDKSYNEVENMKPYDVVQEFNRDNSLDYDDTELWFNDEKETSLSVIEKIVSMYEEQHSTSIVGFLLLSHRSSHWL